MLAASPFIASGSLSIKNANHSAPPKPVRVPLRSTVAVWDCSFAACPIYKHFLASSFSAPKQSPRLPTRQYSIPTGTFAVSVPTNLGLYYALAIK